MIQLAFAAFSATSFLTKAIMIGGLALSLLTAYGVWHHSIYQHGVDDTIAKIARGDTATIKKAQAGRNTYAACRAAGKLWDQGGNRCAP